MEEGKRQRRRRGRRGGQRSNPQPEAGAPPPAGQPGNGRRDTRRRGGEPPPPASGVRRAPDAAGQRRRDTRGAPRRDDSGRPPARRDGQGQGRGRGDADRQRRNDILELPPQDPRSVELGQAFREAHQALRDAARALDKRKAEQGDEPIWLLEQLEAAEAYFAAAADEWSRHLEGTGRKPVARAR